MTSVASRAPKSFPTQDLLLKDPIAFYRQGHEMAQVLYNNYLENFELEFRNWQEQSAYLLSLHPMSDERRELEMILSTEEAPRKRLARLRNSVSWWNTMYILESSSSRYETECQESIARCSKRDQKLFGDQTPLVNFLCELNAHTQYPRPIFNPDLAHLRTSKYRFLLSDLDREILDSRAPKQTY